MWDHQLGDLEPGSRLGISDNLQRRAVGQIQRSHRSPGERRDVQLTQRRWQRDAQQPAGGESEAFDSLEISMRKIDSLEGCTSAESLSSDSERSLRESYGFQVRTLIEYFVRQFDVAQLR